MASITGYTVEATDDLFTAAKDRSNHTGTQASSTISDLVETIQDTLNATLIAGTNITLNYNDAANSLTISSTASGGGSTTTEGVLLSAYTNGVGTAAANTTGIQNWINAALTAKKPAINDLGAIDININARINMIGDKLIVRGNGMRLVQTVNTAAGIIVGAQGQWIDNITVYFSGNPTSTNTAANGVEFSNCLYSRFSNIVVENSARGFYMIQTNPTNNDTNTNTVFSCVFDNIRINGYAISALDLQSWPAGGASSTGNVWLNVYLHNNWFGSNGSPSGWPVIFRGWDESVFDQFNFEWCNPSGDAIFLQESRNLLFNSLHFEGITLTGNSALFRTYFDARAVIHSFYAKSTTIANNSGRKSLFRAYSAGGNPASIDATSVRVASTTNAGSQSFGLAEVESGATGVDMTFRKVDVGDFNGAIIVDPTGVVPSQVEGYNDVRLRNFSAPNIAIDKVRTVNTSNITNTTLVSDATLQFPTTAGTYLIEGELYFTAPAAADLKYRFTHAAAATGKFTVQSLSAAATAAAAQPGNWAAAAINVDQVAGGVDSTEMGIAFRGTLIVTTAGTFIIQYAENAASGNLTVNIGSRLSYRKIS